MAWWVGGKRVEKADYVRFERHAKATLKSLNRPLQESLVDALSDLRIPTDDHDPDEGTWQPKAESNSLYHYRRGLTRAKRQQLDEADRQNLYEDDEEVINNPWDYFLIYRKTTFAECMFHQCPRGVTVVRILTASQVLGYLPGNFPDILNNRSSV